MQSPRAQWACGAFLSLLADSNHVRSCRWQLHEPVQTLANTLILFFDLPREKENANEYCPAAPKALKSAEFKAFSVRV
jgi:hypothetical protein